MTLPKNVRQGIEALTAQYGVVDDGLARILSEWDGRDVEDLMDQLRAQVSTLDRAAAGFVRLYTRAIVLAEYRAAEGVLSAPPLEISDRTLAQVQSRFYQTFTRQNAEISSTLDRLGEAGYRAGSSTYDNAVFQRVVRDQGITGLVRADGSRLSIRATGKAMVRTRVNQLQAESQLDRYGVAGVTMVEFHAGGKVCRYAGEGGPCTSLDGERFPIDDIPEYARIPRHLYSQSRYLPVVDEDAPRAERSSVTDTPEETASPQSERPRTEPPAPDPLNPKYTRQQLIDNYRTMYGKAPSAAMLKRLKK